MIQPWTRKGRKVWACLKLELGFGVNQEPVGGGAIPDSACEPWAFLCRDINRSHVPSGSSTRGVTEPDSKGGSGGLLRRPLPENPAAPLWPTSTGVHMGSIEF